MNPDSKEYGYFGRYGYRDGYLADTDTMTGMDTDTDTGQIQIPNTVA